MIMKLKNILVGAAIGTIIISAGAHGNPDKGVDAESGTITWEVSYGNRIVYFRTLDCRHGLLTTTSPDGSMSQIDLLADPESSIAKERIGIVRDTCREYGLDFLQSPDHRISE
jgi:hypothetical protein